MFKNLKKKLEQGVSQSPLKGALTSASRLFEDNSKDGDPPLAESTPKKKAAAEDSNQSSSSDVSGYATSNQSVEGSPANVPVGQLIDIPLHSPNNQTETGDVTPRASRSRTSSISSMTSEGSFFTNNMSFSHMQYNLPSDLESEMDESGTDLNTVSKEDLYHYIQKYQRRATRYKSKFMDLVPVYKEMVQERDKFKSTLTQCQDRAFRRISELKEQIALDQQAKRDLEENYNLVIEEKGEFIAVLQKQVSLLKEGKDIPPELQDRIQASRAQQLQQQQQQQQQQLEATPLQQAELSGLQEKVKHQEGLLQRCKEIIKSSKEKQATMLADKARVDQELSELQAQFEKLQSTPDTVSKLQQQIRQAREVIEQLETDRQIAIAEVKQQAHEEMERKDGEISRSRTQAQTLAQDNTQLKERIEKLEKASTEQLEKSREIIKRLKAEKTEAIADMESRLREYETKMGMENENLQKQGSDTQNLEQEVNQLQARLAQSEEDFRQMNEQHNRTLQESRELETLVHQMQAEADRQKDEYERLVGEARHTTETSLAQLAADHEKYVAEILTQHQTSLQEKAEEHTANQRELVSRYESQLKAASEDQMRVSESAGQVTELQGALEERQQKFEKLNITLNTLRADLSLKEQELEQRSMEFRTKMEEANIGYREQLSRCDELQAELDNMRAEYETGRVAMETELAELRMHITATEERNQEMVEENNNLQRDLQTQAESTAAIQTLQGDNANLTTELSSLREANTELQSRLDTVQYELTADTEQRHQTLALQMSELQKEKQEAEELRQELQRLTLESAHKDTELVRLTSETSENADIITGLKLGKAEAEDSVAQMEKVLTEMREAHTKLEHELKGCKCQLVDLQGELEKVNKLKEELGTVLNDQKIDLETKVSGLENKFREACEKLEESKKIHSDEINKSEENFKVQLLEKQNQYKESIQKMKEKLQEKVKEKENMFESKLAELMKEKDSTSVEISANLESHYQSVINDLKTEHEQQVENLKTEINKHVEDLQSAEKRFKLQETEMRTETNNVKENLMQELDKAKQELLALEHIHSQLEHTKNELDSNNKQLEQKLEDTTQQLLQSKEQAAQQVLSLSEKHDYEMIEKNNKISELSNALTNVNNTNASLEEMLKEISSLQQLKDDKLTNLMEEYETFKTEMQGKCVALESEVSNLTEHLNDKESEMQKIADMRSDFEQNLKTHYESRLGEMAQSDEELQSQLKVLNDKLSATEQKLQDCIGDYERQLDEYRGKLDRQGRSLSEEKETLAAKLFEMTQQAQKETEELQQTVSAKHSDVEKQKELNEHLEKESERCKTEINELNNQLNELKKEFYETQTLLTEVSRKHADLETDYEAKLIAIKDLTERCQTLDAFATSEKERHTAELQNIEKTWIDKMKALKQKYTAKLKEIQGNWEEKVHRVEESLKLKIDQMNILEGSFNQANEVKEAMSSDLAHANTKLLQLEQNRDTMQELEQQVITLKTQLSDKQELEQQLTQAQFDLEQQLATLNSQLSDKQELEQQLTQAQFDLEQQLAKLNSQLSDKQELEQQLTQTKFDLEQQLSTLLSKLSDKQELELQLSQSKSELEQQVAEFKADLEDKSNKEQDLTKSKSALEQELSELKSDLSNQKELEQQLTKSKSDLEKQVSALMTELSEKMALEQHLTIAQSEMEQQLIAFKSELSSMRELEQQLTSSKSELSNKQELEQQVNVLKAELSDKQKSLQELQDDYNTCKDQIKATSSAVEEKEAHMQQKLREQETKLNDLQVNYNELNEQIEVSKRTITDKEGERNEMEQKLQDIKHVQERQTAEMEGIFKIKSELENEIAMLKLTLQNTRDECESIKSSKLAVEQEFTEFRKQYEVSGKEKQHKITEMEVIIVDNNVAIEKLKLELSNLKENEIQLKQNHDSEISNLRETLEKESADKVAEFKKKAELYISQMKKQIKGDNDTVVKQLQADLEEKEIEVSKLKETETKLSEELASVKESHNIKIDNLKAELNTVSVANQQASEKMLTDLVTDIDTLKSERAELIAKLHKADLTMEELNTEIASLKSSFHTETQNESAYIERQEVKIQELVAEIEMLKKSKAVEIEDLQLEHHSKVKQLAKDFNQQLTERERQFEQQLSQVIDQSNVEDDQQNREMKELLSEAQRDIYERDEKIDELRLEYETKLKEKEKCLQDLESSHRRLITELQQRHDIEIIELKDTMTKAKERSISEREMVHKEEVDGLAQEWLTERKTVSALASAPTTYEPQELLHYHQQTMDVVQAGLGVGDVGHQLIQLNKVIEDMREKHRLEILELRGERAMGRLGTPLLSLPANGPIETGDETPELQIYNLQARVSQLEGELAQTRLRERHFSGKFSQERIPPSPSSPGYFSDGTPTGPLLTEPTQLEYLRNILYKYMMGGEKKTLTRVIGTVVQFTEDQMRQLLAKEDKNSWLLPS